MVFVTAHTDMFTGNIHTVGFLEAFLNLAMITGVVMVFKDQQHKEYEHALAH